MLTKIDLCSMALLKLGETPIQSFSDDTPASKLSQTLFDVVSDALLTAHPWRFACQSYDLSKTDQGDFLVPADCLRIIKCDGDIFGDRILSKHQKMNLIAISRVAPDKYPSYFVSLLAIKLAMEFCIPLTGEQTVFRTLAALYETELQSAKFIDSTMSSNNHIANFSLINTRF